MTTVTLEFPSFVSKLWVEQFCQLYTTDPPILVPLSATRWRVHCNVADAQRMLKFVQQTAISGPDDACRTECESPASQDPADTFAFAPSNADVRRVTLRPGSPRSPPAPEDPVDTLADAVRTLADELKQDRATRLRDKHEGKAFLKAVLQGLCEGVSRHELQ